MQTPRGPRRPSRSRLSLLLSADAAPSHFHNHNYAHDLPDQSFRFTPRATTLQRAPRLWDRKPRPPANPFSRNRRVWKRVLDGSGRGHDGNDNDNNSEAVKGADDGVAVKRGVKRLRVGTHVSEQGEDDHDEVGRGFVETKWVDMAELEAKRKYPKFLHDGHEMSAPEKPKINANRNSETQNVATQVASSVTRQASIDDSDKGALMSITIPPPDLAASPAVCESNDDDKAPRLRYSLLEDDVAEVLSDFLSRAKAKRAAANSPMDNVTTNGNSTHCHSEKNEASPVESGTPVRRALAELDANSPVRQKFAPSVDWESSVTAAKPSADTELHSQQCPQEEEDDDDRKVLESTEGTEAGDEADGEAPDAGAPDPEAHTEEVNLGDARRQQENPRRRTNKKAAAVSTTVRRKGKSAPRVPNTINLRRATGAEFVFKQRSDAQQLALTTKANTKKNKGGAKLPQLALPALRQQQQQQQGQQATEVVAEAENEKEIDKDKDTEIGAGSRKRRRGEPKRVTFDEENLVSYCEEDEGAKGLLSLEDVGLATSGRSKKAATATTGGGSTVATPSATATPTVSGEAEENAPLAQFSPSVPRKVRRLGPVRRSGQPPIQPQNRNKDPTINAPDEVDAERGKQAAKEGRTQVPRADTPKPKRTRNAIPRAVVTRQTDSGQEKVQEKEKEDTGRGARRVAAGWSRAAARRRGGTALGERIKS